ncbi:MAG: hypothetical protein QF531_04295 [Candidatus Poseidonia sp.]|nr:hypothetical protein [Poseidonia sp.]
MAHDRYEAVLEIQHDVREWFGWSVEADIRSAEQMRELVNRLENAAELRWDAAGRSATLEELRSRLTRAEKVVMIGAAVKEEELQRSWPTGTVFVVADGAVGACFNRVEPLCVVTDLDGGVHLEEAARQGVPLVVHAHGDNQAMWRSYLHSWSQTNAPPLVLTHQTPQVFDDMHNPGGFTDGDRAVCFLVWLGVSVNNMELIGYACDHIGRWSGTTNPERKLAKLSWMAKVLDIVMPFWNPQKNHQMMHEEEHMHKKKKPL